MWLLLLVWIVLGGGIVTLFFWPLTFLPIWAAVLMFGAYIGVVLGANFSKDPSINPPKQKDRAER